MRYRETRLSRKRVRGDGHKRWRLASNSRAEATPQSSARLIVFVSWIPEGLTVYTREVGERV